MESTTCLNACTMKRISPGSRPPRMTCAEPDEAVLEPLARPTGRCGEFRSDGDDEVRQPQAVPVSSSPGQSRKTRAVKSAGLRTYQYKSLNTHDLAIRRSVSRGRTRRAACKVPISPYQRHFKARRQRRRNDSTCSSSRTNSRHPAQERSGASRSTAACGVRGTSTAGASGRPPDGASTLLSTCAGPMSISPAGVHARGTSRREKKNVSRKPTANSVSQAISTGSVTQRVIGPAPPGAEA